MPRDSTPRSLEGLMANPPGSTAPINAVGAHILTATFGAPQTICSGSTPPTSTVATRNPSPTSTVATRKRSASGCGTRSMTRPTTTFSKGGAAGSIPPTSRPAMVSCATSSAVEIAGSTHSRNHRSLTFM